MQPLTSATSAGVNLNFGLLNLTVSVHGAVGDTETRLHQACNHGHDLSLVRQRLACPVCDNDGRTELESIVSPFVKVHESPEGLVEVDPAVLEADKEAGKAFRKQIAVSIHPAAEVETVLLPSGKSYYLAMKAATEETAKVYRLIVDMISGRPDLAFMTKFALRTAPSLFQIVVSHNTLVLRQMADADLVRTHPEIKDAAAEASDVQIAQLIAERLTRPFLADQDGVARTTIVAEWVAAQTPVPAFSPVVAVPEQDGTVLDMSGKLKAMLAATEPTTKKTTKKAAAPRKSARKAS
jgi:non-homologous end joining protein Ku